MKRNKFVVFMLILFITIIPFAAMPEETGVIKYFEKMVGRGHPTLADTLNRGFLTEHNYQGGHDNVTAKNVTGDNTGTISGFTFSGLVVDNTYVPSDNSVTSAKILDNTIVNADVNSAANISGSKLADNTVNMDKIKFTIPGAYAKFLQEMNGIIWYMYLDSGAQLGGYELYDTGELTIAAYRPTTAKIGQIDMDPNTDTFSIEAGDNVALILRSLHGGVSVEGVGYTLTDIELSYLDNVTSSIQTQLDAKAPIASPTFTGSVTAPEFVSSAADNTRGVTVPNTADPTGANLAAGKMWVTDNCVRVRNSDNTVTFSAGCQVKTFSFVIDNVVVATDNILLTRVPRAWTLTRADCYASTDNVVGSLMECGATAVTTCTVLDSWTVTNAVDPFTDSSFTDGAVAAGAWIRWSTTSVGTTNSNKLSCTIQYTE